MSDKLVVLKAKDMRGRNDFYNFQHRDKDYKLIRKGISLIGNFDNIANVYIKEVDDQDRVTVFECVDKDDFSILFYGMSPDKKNRLKLNKRKYNYSLRYDLSMAKNNEINGDNIELTRCDYILDTKYGRLATDRYSFYNLFVGKDKVYRIEGDFHGDIALPLVKGVNDANEDKGVINMNVYANIFGKLLGENNLDFTEITLSGYVDFQKNNEVKIKR